MVEKGEPLVRFDTRQAKADATTRSELIRLERADLKDRLNIIKGREDVLEKKVRTKKIISDELGKLVTEGFQRFSICKN